ncbi:efflux RND transporter periplasmic adaptor subunit [Belnapia sp. T18]|uniref:Efflux RND transporter periplasmic adaptor subunit n=1 Tax=Belnapia arida TaxID=2804533 RepID=A0ABS1UC96_9PROT|nr:efflux RND transporter periplasmic adaptor subunit [Belnapia arida]MBL6082302.1 efflux RND transporter periplasmic adaptor subunit [Belnapia arida]
MTVTLAARHDIVVTVPVAGQLVPRREVLVSSWTAGLAVVEILVEEGELVSVGQPLARLDTAVLSAQAARGRAAVAEAEVNAREASAALRRVEAVRGTGAVSGEQLDQRRAAAGTAAARVTAVRAELGEVEARLGQATVRSPVAGRLLQRGVQLGAVVQPGGDPLFRIVEDDLVEFEARLPDYLLPSIRPGGRVEVELGAAGSVAGAVRVVAPRVDAATRLGTVSVTLPGGTYRPGTFATGTLRLEERVSTLTVPATAVTVVGKRARLFAVEDGVARERTVETGLRAGGRVEILRGVREGEPVVVSAAALLRDGQRVAVVTDAPSPMPRSGQSPSQVTSR